MDETILHCALREGNLEIIKLILNKINESNLPSEPILFSKDKSGQTFFHVACMKGYFNIVEYLLKEKKLNKFLVQQDNCGNSVLHAAAINGHSSIIGILCEHGADANIKNHTNLTALDLSCRKGFFEISKTLIANYSPEAQEDQNHSPLHTACNYSSLFQSKNLVFKFYFKGFEGAHEVVKLLLLKGSFIS